MSKDEELIKVANDEVSADGAILHAKIIFKTTDIKWNRLRSMHRKKYPNDDSSMNQALNRAVEEFIKDEF